MIDEFKDNTTGHFPDSDLVSSNPFGPLSILNEYLGNGPLENNLVKADIKRVLEVGVGWNFSTMKQLARLSHQGKPLYSAADLLAIDSNLLQDKDLGIQLGTYRDKFTREKISVEPLRDKIKTEATRPFDLIISQGVASAGWESFNFDLEDNISIQKERESLKKTLQAMRDCMNSKNPQALLMMSSQLEDEVLLLSKQDLEQAGLEVVHFKHADADNWTEILQQKGIFPAEPDDAGYRLVICKIKQ